MPKNYSDEEQQLLLEIGQVIRHHRLKRMITQEEVAERTGLSVTYISDIERGKRNVSVLNLAKLSSAFDLPLEHIFSLKS